MLLSNSFFKASIIASTILGLTACGGGSGYYNNNDNAQTPTADNTAQATSFLTIAEREGKFLFGGLNNTNEQQEKGFIDHALDTFSNGPLQLAIDAKKAFDADRSKFTHYAQCMTTGVYINRGCYVLIGDDTDNILKTTLNSVSANKYSDWDFDVNDNEVSGMKLTESEIDQYTGKSIIIIFENRNADKDLNDVWVSGVFKYPYKQSWGLTQSTQTRVVSMSNTDSDYTVSITYDDATVETKGAISIYKDPTSLDGTLYTIQNNSGFSVLTNDNPNTPNVEPVTFTVNSTPGTSGLATYRIKANGSQVLDLPSITALEGNRIENETPSSGSQSISGSIHFETDNSVDNGGLFQFINAATGAVLSYKHVLTIIDSSGTSNQQTLEGKSTKKSDGSIEAVLTSPLSKTYIFN